MDSAEFEIEESSEIDESSSDFGSLGALAPAWREGDAISEEEALETFYEWLADHDIDLWPHQDEALMSLMVGDHVILGTPTGSGKSMVAIGMMFMALCSGKRAFYTAPIKALVSEKFFGLVDMLGRENVGMITGDSQINPQAPVICCTAEILANQALREGEWSDVGCVAMDEFHFYSDPDRGWAWQVPLLTLPHTQFLLMSATLGDVSQIAQALESKTGTTVDVIADAPRPVPLEYKYELMSLEGTVELALRNNEGPLYIVHFSQDAALASAQALSSFGVTSKEQREQIKATLGAGKFTTQFGKTLKRLLLSGIGVHHAGMLPRYRLLVEKLAQQGLLPVICGTDTLGVGINVPIHTVVLTQLTKFDGHKMRRLRSREFHQIAGRAGRSGFDTEGVVVSLAPEFEIENAKLLAKAGDDPKKRRKVKRKKPPEGFVVWNEDAFNRLIAAAPETLTPRMRITHSMVLAEVEQGGDARARVDQLIDDSLQKPEDKLKLKVRASEVFRTLIDAGVVEIEEDENGDPDYYVTMDLPEDFALDQPLSPFLLAALELLDPESETYTYDIISMVEATLEDPRQVLRAQERKAKDAAMAAMKADGVEYEERLDRIAEVTYPRPLRELLFAAFDKYCESVPWARDYYVRPKSVLRDMLESAADFKGYIQKRIVRLIARSRLISAAKKWKTLSLGSVWWCVRSTPAWWMNGSRRVKSSMPVRPRQRMLWSMIAVASPCWCATPCSVECVLLRQMIMRLWAKPTLITGSLFTNGARRWTNTTMFMKTCLSMRMPAQWHSWLSMNPTRIRSTYGMCGKPSAILTAIMILPSAPMSILMRPKKATAWCSRTTASALSKTFCNSFFHCSLGKGGQLPFKVPSRCLEKARLARAFSHALHCFVP